MEDFSTTRAVTGADGKDLREGAVGSLTPRSSPRPAIGIGYQMLDPIILDTLGNQRCLENIKFHQPTSVRLVEYNPTGLLIQRVDV